jgi:prepilin-type N-terminal cleavage/methylation domain-containing protein
VAHNDKGMTLIEVLAAVVILSILVLTFTNISGFTALSSGKTDKKAGALRLAELTMNTIRETVNTANANSSIMNTRTLPQPSPDTVGIYHISRSEDDLTSNPAYSLPSDPNRVSVQDVFIMHDTSTNKDVNRLITIFVSWVG